MASVGIKREDVEDWLSPPAAVKELEAVFGTDSHSSIVKRTLLDRLKGRQIRAAAACDTTAPYMIEPTDWKEIDETHLVWTTGDLAFEWMAGSGYNLERRFTRHFTVRFEPASVRAIIAAAAKTKSGTSPKTSTAAAPEIKGGRPRKEFWDDFWIEICLQLADGDLKPKTQADLQRAMHEWVENHGHDAGETAIKVAARKLWKAWKLEGEN